MAYTPNPANFVLLSVKATPFILIFAALGNAVLSIVTAVPDPVAYTAPVFFLLTVLASLSTIAPLIFNSLAFTVAPLEA